MIRQPMWDSLSRLPEKGGKEIEEKMKERDREENGTGMRAKNKRNKTFPLYLYLLHG